MKKSSAVSLDAKSVTVTLKNQGHEKEQINRATIGQGTIIVDGVSMTDKDLPGLNRDVTKAQEVTKDQITNQLDANVTIDVRFWGSVYDVLTGATEEVKDENGNVIKDADGNPLTRKKELSVVTDTKAIAKAVSDIMQTLSPRKREALLAEIKLQAIIATYTAEELSDEEIIARVLEETGIDLNNKKELKKFFSAKITELENIAKEIENLEYRKRNASESEIISLNDQIFAKQQEVGKIYELLPLDPNYVNHKTKLDKKLIKALSKNPDIQKACSDDFWKPLVRNQDESDTEFQIRNMAHEAKKLDVLRTAASLQSEIYGNKNIVLGVDLVNIPSVALNGNSYSGHLSIIMCLYG
jgi:hypothetical protein